MLTIAWDVDDVLNDLMRVWLERAWLPEHSGCRAAYEDLRANPPHELLGIRLEEYLASLDAFRRTHYLEELAPRPEVLAWFERHGGAFRHMALTATPLACAPISAAWVLRHFGKWIRSFHFVPSARAGETIPTYDRGKQDFLSWWGQPAVLVDDQPANVEAVRRAGGRAILTPRPWNGGAGTIAQAIAELENL
jgi:hypothetical protein